MRLLSRSLDVTMLLLLQETYINKHNYLQKMNTKMEALAKHTAFTLLVITRIVYFVIFNLPVCKISLTEMIFLGLKYNYCY